MGGALRAKTWGPCPHDPPEWYRGGDAEPDLAAPDPAERAATQECAQPNLAGLKALPPPEREIGMLERLGWERRDVLELDDLPRHLREVR